ncbi:MAG: LysR family transcriptional regulator [Hyphomicrobiaceae bacterium]|nr:LysR family transcriptional regulator [Hyphomicrobiaceae bacterium]
MDIAQARTFLTVADTGSFVDAARRMNITQSTVSARIKSLEELLGRVLFERSKAGAVLTPAGHQFQRHALALIRIWQQAQVEVTLADELRDHLSIGAELSLWDGLGLRWLSWLRRTVPDLSLSAVVAAPRVLTERLLEGTLDLAILYRPEPPPGLVVEHLFEEELVLVSSVRSGGRRRAGEYAFVDWGPDFRADHAAALPKMTNASLKLEIGSLALDYLLANPASAYLPMRLAKPALAKRQLRLVSRARKFRYPVAMVFPEERDEEAFEPLLQGLRRVADRLR